MSGSRNDLLRHKDLTADGAVAALRQAVLGAGGFPLFVNDFRMSGSRNDLLRHKDLAADGAVAAVAETVFRAGGRHPIVKDFRMSGSRNDLLRHKDLAADGAVAALRQAVLGAGGRLCLVNGHGMGRGDDDLLGENLTAGRAIAAVAETVFRAGRPVTLNHHSLMGDSLHALHFLPGHRAEAGPDFLRPSGVSLGVVRCNIGRANRCVFRIPESVSPEDQNSGIVFIKSIMANGRNRLGDRNGSQA